MTISQPSLLSRFISQMNYWANKRSTLWFLFFLSLATLLIGTKVGGTRAEDDDHWHLQIAQHFFDGNGLRLDTEHGPTYSYIQPGFAAIHIAFMTVFKDHFILAERVFLLLFSASTVILFFFLCTRFFPRGLALFAAFIWALYPPQWFWMTRLNPHSFATNMLICCFLLFYLAWENENAVLAFVTGFLWGALTLMRPEYQLGIFCLAFASLFYFKNWNKKLLFSFLLVFGWALFLTPWTIRNYKIHGFPVVSTTHFGINVWMVFHPEYTYQSAALSLSPELEEGLKNEPNEVKRARLYVAEAKKNVRANPKMAVERLVVNFLTYWRPWLSPKVTSLKENIVYVGSYLPIFILFLIGLFRIPWRDPKWIAVYTFMAYKVMAHVPFYMIVRFREATFPMLLLISMLALQTLWERNSFQPNSSR